MIAKPTVFVLGAGASIPYSYPSGEGLVIDIFQNIVSNEWKSIFNAFGIKESDVDMFRAELHQSHQPSVDTFLEHRPEFNKVGKVCIAMSLLSKEIPDVLLDFNVRRTGIYDFLYSSLATSWEDFKQNRLTIITFNYDRSLEHFLFSALKHSYDKPDAEVAEVIHSIPIIHVHGSLGPLPWQAPDGTDYYPLFSRIDKPEEMGRRIRVASENIVIVSEAQPKSQEFAFALERFKEADRIYFLGFGYYPVNLERLGLAQLDIADPEITESLLTESRTSGAYHDDGKSFGLHKDGNMIAKYALKHYRGSALGLGSAQIQAVQRKWRIGLLDNKSNALEFLKEYADLS